MSKKNLLLFLGAGFSKDAECPLQNNFFKHVEQKFPSSLSQESYMGITAARAHFDEVIRLDPEDLEGSISRLVEEYDPHIIHSHNAPDYLTVSALKAFEGAPVIHDIHDSLTMRSTGYYEGDDEARARVC